MSESVIRELIDSYQEEIDTYKRYLTYRGFSKETKKKIRADLKQAENKLNKLTERFSKGGK